MGATGTSVAAVVQGLMVVLSCVMVAAFAYVFAIDGILSCFDMHVRWAIPLLIDHSIYVAVIGPWFVYKESSWIKTAVFLVLLYTLGSLSTCVYILIQFSKLSPEEISKDPLYFVLVKHHKRGHTEPAGPSVVTARVIFSAIGGLMLGAIIYTLINDLSSSRTSAFAPCFLTYITDIYVHAVVLAVWIAYKESSWISASLWILLLLSLGNVTTCAYIVRELFYLSPHDPVSLIIFNNRRKQKYAVQ